MASAISVKSQSSQNINPIMKKMVMISTRISRVEDEAKFCSVVTSVVMVEISAPLLAWS